ncbi:MAG: TRAP transporter large permease subunit [Myxococcota bacterium]|nr:TRAP transporter large permease subunit [Myxococcota bacterium]
MSGEVVGPEAVERTENSWHQWFEDRFVAGVFIAAITLPLLIAVGRPFAWRIDGAAELLRHLTLWMTFFGALLTTREEKHLRLSSAELLGEGPLAQLARVLSAGAAAAICWSLAAGSWEIVLLEREGAKTLSIGLPVWISQAAMPLALALMGFRFLWRCDSKLWGPRLGALAMVGVFLGVLQLFPEPPGWILILILVSLAALGTPIFAAMGGLALALYYSDGEPLSAVPVEVYRLITSPTLPAIPLLTACGYFLAESGAAQRLVRFFKALFGWMPGGMALLACGVCALFTAFTGGSGVTLIALGGLVYGVLRSDQYPEGFSLGFVTASSSLGLLFPPSLPVILYAVVVSASPEFSVAADQLYIAGFLPGILMMLLVAAWGMRIGAKVEGPRPPFSKQELWESAKAASWELSIPVLVIGLFLSGWVSMVEAAAFAALYALFIEVLITRDINPRRDLVRVLGQASVLVGAVLILLAASMGLSAYCLVEADLPERLLGFASQYIESKWVFLLALNGLLLLLGSILEIYSALVILPPLLAPMALHYGVDPVHLGIIFLANLELGFLTPPVGLNLFLAAARFEVPVFRLYREVLPPLLILLVSVLLITYWPALSIGFLAWVTGGG